MSDTGVVFLEGFSTILRPPDKRTDLEAMTRWINDPELRQYIMMCYPQTFQQEEAWFDRLGTNDKEVVLAIVVKPELRLIGTMGLHAIDRKNGVATTGTLIGDRRYRNKGYGTDAKMALLEYAFHDQRLNRIASRAFAANPRSIAYSRKCGYRIEGTLREAVFKNGRYGGIVELGVLRREWEPIWRRWKKTGKVR